MMGGSSLWVVGSDGSGERLLATSASIRYPIWDPTGRLIAFQIQAGEEKPAHLRVVTVEDGSVRDIEGPDLRGHLMAWSPDGQWLAMSETVGRTEFRVNRDILGEGGM